MPNGSSAADTIEVFPPPELSANLVIQQYREGQQRGARGNGGCGYDGVGQRRTPLRPPSREESSLEAGPLHADSGGASSLGSVVSEGNTVKEPSSSGRSGQQPMLSSPAANGSSGSTPASARKPVLSGRSWQLKRMQASSLGLGSGSKNMSGCSSGSLVDTVVSSGEGGNGVAVGDAPNGSLRVARTPSSVGVGVGGLPLPIPTCGSGTVLLMAADSSLSSTSRHPSFSNANATANGNSLLLPQPTCANENRNGSLSRQSSSGSASFRRHFHLSSIASCNYGSSNYANNHSTTSHLLGNTSLSSAPLSPALSTMSTGAAKPSVAATARMTFQRATMPAAAGSPHAAGETSATANGVSGGLKPLLRQEYRDMQRDLLAAAVGPATVVTLPSEGRGSSSSAAAATHANRLPATNAPVTFQHRKKRSCPLHSKAGRAAEERRQEAERLRLLQQQRHDEQIISNGGRETVDPGMKSSARIAGSSSKLLHRARSRRGSFTGSGSGDAPSLLTSPERPPLRSSGNSFFVSPGDAPSLVTTGGGKCEEGSLADGTSDSPSHRPTRGRGARGGSIVVELQRERRSSSSSSSFTGSDRSSSPPLFASSAVGLGGESTNPGRHRINYHEAVSPSPYRRKKGNLSHDSGSDTDSDDGERVFSFYRQRQTRVQRTPMASESLSTPEGSAKPLEQRRPRGEAPDATKSNADLPMKEHTDVRESLVGSLFPAAYSGGGGKKPVAESEVKAADPRSCAVVDAREDGIGSAGAATDTDEECCYCCPCRRPENFFLLCQKNGSVAVQPSPSPSPSLSAPAASPFNHDSSKGNAASHPTLLSDSAQLRGLTEAEVNAEPATAGSRNSGSVNGTAARTAPGRRPHVRRTNGPWEANGNGGRIAEEADDEEDDDGLLLTVASFRRSSVRKISSR